MHSLDRARSPIKHVGRSLIQVHVYRVHSALYSLLYVGMNDNCKIEIELCACYSQVIACRKVGNCVRLNWPTLVLFPNYVSPHGSWNERMRL